MTQGEEHPVRLDGKACYAALQSHDARFDGRFFVGVSSTGIYCRPICRVKLPKEENCTFFGSAASAEAAGYRPCRRCRPELAPGLAPTDSTSRIARKAAMAIEESCLADLCISDLARMLGITDRHLRRAFSAEYGVSPLQYLQTRRLLLAKGLLADTSLPVTQVALAAGFGSIRSFNDLFKKHYRSTPGQFRSTGKNILDHNETITLSLGYRPPYAWEELIRFLSDRAIPGVECVEDGIYRRTVALRSGGNICFGWVCVGNMPGKNSLSVTVACTLLPVLSKVLARIRCLFDVNCSPSAVYDKLRIMNELVPDICVPGLRLPGCFDPFEISVRAVLGQQVTVKAARTLAMRFAETFGVKVTTPFDRLNRTFPAPDAICALEAPVEDHLGPLGITRVRARSIRALAEAIVTGSISVSPGADPELEMDKLLRLPGFGPWTVQYIGMRAFGWPDAFPHTDYGVKKALCEMTPTEILELSQAWRPWRSYATISLWNSLAEKISV